MRIDEFLLARIAEDEAVARQACRVRETQSGDSWTEVRGRHGLDRVLRADGEVGEAIVEAAPHIARHDPARVLAECEAKRRIVERLRPAMITMPDDAVLSLMDPSEARAVEFMHSVIVTSLAQPYADHPDFDPAWRVTGAATVG